MSRQQSHPTAGQLMFMPEECPACGDNAGERTGLKYDQRTRRTFECWRCSCGKAFRLLVSQKTTDAVQMTRDQRTENGQ